jgi:FkbH-like protein
MPLNTAEFLFPRDLEVSPTRFDKVLFIGSCLSERYVLELRQEKPDTVFDLILFNNAADLPARTDAELRSYDLQYLQIPLRSVLTDAIVRLVEQESQPGGMDWIALGQRNIVQMLDKAMAYNEQSGLLTLVSNFIVPQGRMAPSLYDQDSEQDIVFVVRELNAFLAREVRRRVNAYVADIDMIANSLGKRYFLDDIIFFYTHGAMFYTDWSGHERFPDWTAPAPGRIEEIPDLALTYDNRNAEFVSAAYRQIEWIHRIVNKVDSVKIVIFDLDNTLWRGQLIEHYQPGMALPYSDGWPLGIWEAVQHLRRRGIVVALASKNDLDAVEAMWDAAVRPPFLKFSDFLTHRIDWNSKATNIKSILEEVALTPASALFVDDNPIERESVRVQLPGIRVMGSDPFLVRRALLWSAETQIPVRSRESASRETLLRKQIRREDERASMSRPEFLASLKSTIDIWRLADIAAPSFSRISELVNKTNQFNTSGQRWTVDDYKHLFDQGGCIYAFSVSDRFVEYGTVGALMVLGDEIVQYVMSCRVLGMDVELAALGAVVDTMRESHPTRTVISSIVPTTANTPVRKVYTNAGFAEDGAGRFRLDPWASKPSIDHVKINLAETHAT